MTNVILHNFIFTIPPAVEFRSLFGIQSVAEVVRCDAGKLRRFGHLEWRVWMIGFRPVEMWRWLGRSVGAGAGRLG